MVDSALFIGAMIIAVTQVIKIVFPQVTGAITVIVAVLMGALVGVLAPYIGVDHVTIAQGIMDALAAVGVHTVVSSAASN